MQCSNQASLEGYKETNPESTDDCAMEQEALKVGLRGECLLKTYGVKQNMQHNLVKQKTRLAWHQAHKPTDISLVQASLELSCDIAKTWDTLDIAFGIIGKCYVGKKTHPEDSWPGPLEVNPPPCCYV
ncbi:hypothetical protein NDU88_006264 [Pleurodeles waltl]|uniref:Uncharacterized protein n=1 Tax=Pleurodeles waltl TaxID=8319 RepID=A0AAV7RPR9_PLEWA|nr:hypothetical protein NDU88_006264 [Pleurodeles waltl]